jgi:hypothetical protein
VIAAGLLLSGGLPECSVLIEVFGDALSLVLIDVLGDALSLVLIDVLGDGLSDSPGPHTMMWLIALSPS